MSVPKLRFKADDGSKFPDWKEDVLSNICEFITVGIANSATHAYRDNGVIMFRNQNIKENQLDISDLIYIDPEFEQKYAKKRLKANDLLVVRTGYPGVACIVPSKYEGAQTFTTLIVRLIQNLNVPEYVCQYINSPLGKSYFESTQIGGGQKNCGAGILEKFPILLPRIDEQQKIADFLSAIDTVIEKQQATVEAWEQRKKGVMQKLFNQEVRFKAEDGSDFPDWEEKKLSDIVSMHARIGWQGLRREEFLNEGEYYLITGTDFVDGKISLLKCHFIGKERYEQDVHIQIKNGDILITKDGTIGKVALVENLDKPATLNAGIFVLRFISNGVVEYLYQYLGGPYMLNYSKKHSTGGTIKHLNQGVLVNFPVPYPSLSEQRKIAACLSSMDDVIKKQKEILEKWKALKKGLLQQMFV